MKVGFFGCLTLIFITLKLCGAVTWSWWLVLLPLYGPLTAVLVVLALGALFVKYVLK